MSVAARYRIMTELKRAGDAVPREDLQRRLPDGAALDDAIAWLERRGLVRANHDLVLHA